MNKYLKIILVTFLAIFCINFFSLEVNAATNKEYAEINVTDATVSDNLAEENADMSIGDTIMNYIGIFIFDIAKLIESAVTNFSKWAFGVDVFPWEDYIVFNAMPYLDINFFNASPGSMFKSIDGSTAIGDIVRSVYFTLLTLSLSILGIGVSVVAIRLAISSIASEKAKYKEAITKCLYTVVMLFSVHILISFVYYLNETIVSAAGNILESVLNNDELIEQQIKTYASDEKKEQLNNWLYRNILQDASGLSFGNYLTNLGASFDSLTYSDEEKERISEFERGYSIIFSDSKAFAIGSYILNSQEFIDKAKENGGFIGTDGTITGSNDMSLDGAQKNALLLLEKVEDVLNAKSVDELNKQYQKDAYNMFMSNKKINLISSLAEYFKTNANDELEGEKINYVALILYCIMILQSLSLLISYIKRIFYVTLLALLAPIVVIYDFFISSI